MSCDQEKSLTANFINLPQIQYTAIKYYKNSELNKDKELIIFEKVPALWRLV